MSASFEEGTAKTDTNGWSHSTTNQSAQTYNDAVQTASQAGRQISGGSISMGVQITNTGEISYNLTDLAVTALQHLPQQNSFAAIGTLLLANPLGGDASFGSIGSQLFATGDGVSLAPGQSTGILQVKTDIAAGNKILDLMANPASLYFDIGNFGITNAQKVDFNFIDQITNAQTGMVLIDFGGNSVVSKRVATNVARVNGQIAGITLGEIMKTLGIAYETSSKVVDGQTFTVLTGVQDPDTGQFMRVDPTNNRFWVALKTAQELAPLAQNFEDIVLQASGAMYVLYVTDADHDNVYLRDENLYGTSDANADSDGDGLSDFDEIATGWQVAAQLPPRYPVQVFSNPTVPDSDGDGLSDAQEKALGTDPNNPDTDNDLLCDGPGSTANASGICGVRARQDPQPLVPQFSFAGSSPEPYVFNAAANAPIVVNFSLPVRGTSTIKVRSLTRGPVQGTAVFSNGGRTMTFTPQQVFMPNEVIDVSLLGETSADTGAALPDYHYNFKVASPAGGGFATTVSDTIDLNDNPLFRPNALVSGDFNQDGVLDFALTAYQPASVGSIVSVGTDSVYVGLGIDGGGGFQPAVEIVFPSGSGPQALVAGDFNNDGRPDLAVSLVGSSSAAVLLAGATQGQFDPPSAMYSTAVGKSPIGIAAGDLNGDGNLDLVVANNGGSPTHSILAGKGDGTFSATAITLPGVNPSAVALADVNADGFLDIIAPFDGPGSAAGVTVALGNGDATFQPGLSQSFSGTGFPVAIATGDFNGDGLPDFVTANQRSNDVSLFISKGNGAFAQQANIPVGIFPTAVVTGDFNGDGKLDIATAGGQQTGSVTSAVTILYGRGQDSFDTLNLGDIGVRSTALVVDAFRSVSPGTPLNMVVAGFGNSFHQEMFVINTVVSNP